MNSQVTDRLNRVQRPAWIAGGAAAVACTIGAFVSPREFFQAYLVGYLFWLGLTLGCFTVAMMHHLTGGSWGFVTRRLLEAGFMTLPLMAVLFVPIAFGLSDLYPWAGPEAAGHAIEAKRAYLNPPAFRLRAAGCFALWLGMAWCLRRWSLQQDATVDLAPTRRLRTLSGPGIVLFPITGTFAFIDWVMSTEPEWYSTIFGILVLIGQVLNAYAWVIVLLGWLRDEPPFTQVLTPSHFHNLGNLLLAFVIFWTYVTFSQLLIIYAGNLPQEIHWYLHRIAGGWRWIIGAVALFHFFLPFVFLLFRSNKRHPSRLVPIAATVLLVHALYLFWMVAPSFHPTGIRLHWLDLVAPVAVGGLWIGVFLSRLKGPALVPRHDPRMEPLLSDAS